jgi:hypothetical protein
MTSITKDKVRYSRAFSHYNYPTKEEALAAAITYVEVARGQLHGKFANHGN